MFLRGHLSPDAAQAFFEGRGLDDERLGLSMVPLSPAIGMPQESSAAGEAIYSFRVLPPR